MPVIVEAYFQFHWMDSPRAETWDERDKVYLSIPLNGFFRMWTGTVATWLQPSFNSIEWILTSLNINWKLATISFNSIEWIPEKQVYHYARKPVVSFNSIEWIPGEYWLTITHLIFRYLRVLSIPLNGFLYREAARPVIRSNVFLSIPLNGFSGWTLCWASSLLCLLLSIPLNGFFGGNSTPQPCAYHPFFQFHWMDS